MKHPIQPIEKDSKGVLRFKSNAIVRHLLDNGGIDLNKLAMLEFSQNDREQFAQLIGYSVSGLSELSYVSDETVAAAEKMHSEGLTEDHARIAYLEETLAKVEAGLRDAAVAVFRIHPDDLHR